MSFTVENKSVGNLFGNDEGFYIPSFQRSFSWGKEQINPLFEGINELHREFTVAKDSSIDIYMFFGSVLTVIDKKHDEIIPAFHSQLPKVVKTIIDGQQRISVLTIVNIVLHDKINKALKLLRVESKSKKSPKEYREGLKKCCFLLERISGELQTLFVIDRHSGECPLYPKVIRSIHDVWSTEERAKKYNSAIGNFQWEYIINKNFNTKTNNVDPTSSRVITAHRLVIKEIDELCILNKHSDINIIKGKKLVECVERIDANLENEIKDIVLDKQDSNDCKEKLENSLRLIYITKLIHNRVCVVAANLEDINLAFSIFDSLNTTGEQLTALETFKPTIIKTISLKKFENSVFDKHFKIIEKFFGGFKPENKQSAAANFVVNFALGESGEKIGKKLPAQRKYLNKRYNKIQHNELGDDKSLESNTKKDFIRRLSYLASFMQDVWHSDSSDFLNKLDEEAEVLLYFLNHFGHTITIPVLSYFYSQYQRISDKESNEASQAIEIFKEALFASVAFTILWRGARGGTANIDSKYREIIADLISFKVREKNEDTDTELVKKYKVKLKEKLVFELSNKSTIDTEQLKKTWIDNASKVEMYTKANTVAKIMLLLAEDRAIISNKKDQAYLELVRDEFGRKLSLEKWIADYDIEHIAPSAGKNNKYAWKGSSFDPIYEQHSENTLGNLLYLPSVINRGMLRKCGWNQKREIYKLLGSKTDDDFKAKRKQIDNAQELGLNKIDFDELMSAGYHILCQAMGRYKGNWKLDLIRKRTEILLGFVWDRVTPWLFTDDK